MQKIILSLAILVLTRLRLLVAFWGMASLGFAGQYDEPLNHFGLARISDKTVQQQFASRFNAKGEPLFMVGNLRNGVSIGDMIRFKDKVVLIDAEVWQTMKTAGVLELLQNSGVVTLKAKTDKDVWNGRAAKTDGIEKKGYKLGADFLETIKQNFADVPGSMEIILRFEDDNLTLLAPNQLLKNLTFKIQPRPEGKIVVESRAPFIVSEDHDIAFVGSNYQFYVWAVDMGSPGADLSYTSSGSLPPGLYFSTEKHALVGKPTKAGKWNFALEVKNDKTGRNGTQNFEVTIRENQAPKILGTPPSLMAEGERWQFAPIIVDPDHQGSELTAKVTKLPDDMVWNQNTQTFSIKSGVSKGDFKELEGMTFALQVTDPLGKSVTREFGFNVTEDLQFRSQLTVHKMSLGQFAEYIPVAQGPSSRIKYSIVDMENKEISDGSSSIHLNTSSPGFQSYEVVAEDDLGNKVFQRLGYEVTSEKSILNNFTLRTQNLAGNNITGHLYYQYKSTRWGIFQSQLLETGSKTSMKELPFVVVGFNALGDINAARGNTLFIEGGMKLWAKNNITAGGWFLRGDGKWNNFTTSDLVVEYMVQYYINQGVAIFDYEAVADRDFGDKNGADSILGAVLSDQNAQPVQNHYNEVRRALPGVDEMLTNYEDPFNEVLLLEFKTWMYLAKGLGVKSVWAAPIYWYEDHLHSSRKQHGLGIGLKFFLGNNWLNTDLTTKLGVTSDDGPQARVELSTFLGQYSH